MDATNIRGLENNVVWKIPLGVSKWLYKKEGVSEWHTLFYANKVGNDEMAILLPLP